jgi:hypothetical protein
MENKFKCVLLFCLFLDFSYAQSFDATAYLKKYNERIKMSRIDDIYIPKNTEDAMKELLRLTDPDGRTKILSVPEDSIASKLHFSLGRWMLINWGFEEGSRISHYYKENGVSNFDDMLDLLIRSFYRTLAQKPIKEKELFEWYISKRKKEHDEKIKKSKVIKNLGPVKKHME